MVFIDTPGIINKTKYYSKQLSREIFKNIEQVDINLFVFDSTKDLTLLKKKKLKKLFRLLKKIT